MFLQTVQVCEIRITCCAGEWFFMCIISCSVTDDHSHHTAYKGRVCTKFFIALLAEDSVVALVTDEGAEFHNCTEGY